MSKILSICMIIRNQKDILAKTLPNKVKIADEVIVVDTGSVDGAKELARELGAKVFEFPWANDFSAARNESLKHAEGEWIIWLDTDEFMKEEDLQALKDELSESKEEAYMLPLYECCPGTVDGTAYYYRVKVFRNHKGYHFERIINEQVYDRGGKFLQGKVLSNIPIYHWGGKLDPQKMKKKKERNIKLLKKAIIDSPKDSYYHYLLAENYLYLKSYDLAIENYNKVVEFTPRNSLAATALTKKARCLYFLGRKEEAYQSAKQALELKGDNAEASNIIGTLYLDIGNVLKAIQVLEHSRSLKIPLFSDIGLDVNEYTYMPNFLLGNAYFLARDMDKAIDRFRKAYKFIPNEDLKKRIESLEHFQVMEVMNK